LNPGRQRGNGDLPPSGHDDFAIRWPQRHGGSGLSQRVTSRITAPGFPSITARAAASITSKSSPLPCAGMGAGPGGAVERGRGGRDPEEFAGCPRNPGGLPAELDHGQRVELVRDFCQRQFVDRGMVADIALHAPGREGDDRNHHAHILLTTREIAAEGFTTKNRDWNAVEVLEGWREAWAQDANLALELAGHGERIDHRTLEAQRIEALELAHVAQEQGHEAEALEHTVRAVALDRPPCPNCRRRVAAEGARAGGCRRPRLA
jgi:hypothetical protein